VRRPRRTVLKCKDDIDLLCDELFGGRVELADGCH
jgi:hypothetical protein